MNDDFDDGVKILSVIGHGTSPESMSYGTLRSVDANAGGDHRAGGRWPMAGMAVTNPCDPSAADDWMSGRIDLGVYQSR